MIEFLKTQKLDMYIDTFRENGIDGDILSAITSRKDKVKLGSREVVVADLILQEDLGMKTAMHRLKVKGKIRGFCDSLMSLRSTSILASSRSIKK